MNTTEKKPIEFDLNPFKWDRIGYVEKENTWFDWLSIVSFTPTIVLHMCPAGLMTRKTGGKGSNLWQAPIKTL